MELSTNLGFVIGAIGLGAAFVALWVQARFPKLAPKKLGFVIVHLLGAHLVAQGLVPSGMSYVDGRPLAAVFGVAFPGLVYMFLAWIWFIKVVQAMLSGGGGGGLMRRAEAET